MNKKTIFITGAGQGIVKATAQLFAKKGWFVGLSDINQQNLDNLASELGKENCVSYFMDVQDIPQIKKVIAEFGQQTGGRMDVLFNNAGILFTGGFGEKVALEKQHSLVNINLNGLLSVSHIALPFLKATPKSTLMSMCSASSIMGNPDLTVYAATKSAVKSLTEGLNMLFKKDDIHVTDLCPGNVKTDMLIPEQEHMGLTDKMMSLGPEDVAMMAWNALSSKKVHHYKGANIKLVLYLRWLLPYSVFQSILTGVFFKDVIAKN